MSITALIRNRFCFAPPCLLDIIDPFAVHEYRFKLIRLAEEYLPKEREALMTLPPAAAHERFVNKFSKAYFPLELYQGYGEPAIKNAVESIPITFKGIEQGDYEPRFDRFPSGQLIAEVLCQCPWLESIRAQRGPVLDAFTTRQKLTPKALLDMIPENGYSLEEMERVLIRNLPVKYAGLLTYCRWLFGKTGNVWLDRSGDGPAWTRKNVDLLKQDYPGYVKLHKEMKAFDDWLSTGRDGKYAEIITYIHDMDPQRIRTRVRINAG